MYSNSAILSQELTMPDQPTHFTQLYTIEKNGIEFIIQYMKEHDEFRLIGMKNLDEVFNSDYHSRFASPLNASSIHRAAKTGNYGPLLLCFITIVDDVIEQIDYDEQIDNR